ncbi:hypothetical protein BBB56_07645 [Candidatus Pantoea deserta]|uniref:Uncharacterized protein n=1 Tax=Candidatus Pantoea deserta TaxID=1869313 RepID=A0A3N4P1L6_9GAMM|nr:hypothetical protein [Pantoea deserta]RPE02165.1 hypothetical protein BBB56_07645 [Pantoea deserta]
MNMIKQPAVFMNKVLCIRLFKTWGDLSSNVRKKMKKDALKWIAFKKKQCGDVEFIQSDTLSLQEKKDI